MTNVNETKLQKKTQVYLLYDHVFGVNPYSLPDYWEVAFYRMSSILAILLK